MKVFNERGSSLISVMIAAALLPLGLSLFFNFVQLHYRNEKTVTTMVSASVVRNNFKSLVSSSAAWQKTVEDSACNPTLKCIKDGTDCGASTAPRVVNCLYDAGGNLVYNAKTSGMGFNHAGKSCNAGEPFCDFRPRIAWQSACTTAPCTAQPYQVRVTIEYQGSEFVAFNSERFYSRSLKR